MPDRARGTNFAITVNNWTQDQYDTLHVFITQKCSKGIIGKEKGESGTLHLQCAIVTRKRFYFDTLIADLGPGFHIEAMKKPWNANKNYCLKDDPDAFLFEIEKEDKPDSKQGLRQDLAAAKDKIRKAGSWKAVMDDDELAPVIAKYSKWSADIWASRPFPTMDVATLRSWQHDLIAELSAKPDQRKIIWFYDLLGDTGKSFLSRLLCCNYGAIEMPNKTAEVYFLYQGQKIIIWDLARTVMDRVPYEPIEKVKNGSVISTKYCPEQKIFDQPHVVVFANYPPNDQAWSKDRYDIRTEFNCDAYNAWAITEVD